MFTAAEKLACAKRELRMRHKVYPSWVARGKMFQNIADREIAIMQEIVADYERQEREERLI